MNFISNSYKTIFLNTAYLDRTEYFPQSYEVNFCTFLIILNCMVETLLGHADLKNGSCHYLFEWEVNWFFELISIVLFHWIHIYVNNFVACVSEWVYT